MADSPRKGVVDRNCAVFDAPNLYIASAAVFPTNSHANPTLTIVAFAVRLAEHLRSELRPSAAAAGAGRPARHSEDATAESA
jgi:choline dehydrogenase-like flavoprotein